MPRERNNSVIVRMNDKEYEKFLKLQRKSKLTKQEFVLRCLLQKQVIVVEGILNLAEQIRRIGVNINQIAHLANENENVNEEQIYEVSNKMSEVYNILSDFIKSKK